MGAITVRVPEVLNLASLVRFEEDLAAAARADGVVRLEGGDGVFCRGLDFGAAFEGGAPAAMAAFCRCLAAVRFARRPVIAVVDGEALAGGVGIAAACDAVVATTRATFALPEALFGLAPAAIEALLRERMTAQKARLIALCGRAYDASEALSLGLADAVVAPSELPRAIQRWTRALDRGEPGACSELKARGRGELEAAIARGAAQTLAALATPIVRARIAAFEAGEAAWEQP